MVVSVYFLIYLFLPMLFQYHYFEDILSIYSPQKYNFNSILFSALTILMFLILYVCSKKLFSESIIILPWHKVSLYIFKLYLKYRNYISVICFFIAVFTIYSGSSNLRYTTSSLSQKGSSSFIISITKTIIYFDLITIFFSYDDGYFSKFYKRKIISIIFLCSHFLLIGGSADTLIGMIILGRLYFKKTFSFLFYKNKNDGLISFKAFLRYLSIFLLFFPIISLVVAGGNFIKADLEVVQLNILFSFLDSLNIFLLYIGESFSSHVHSLNFSISNHSNFNDNSIMEVLNVPLNSLKHRTNILLGHLPYPLDNDKPIYSSLTRFNYLKITGNYSDLRQGTSPGVLASFVYLGGGHLGAVICALYLNFISKKIDILYQKKNKSKRVTLIGVSIILFLFLFCFQSPLDFINVIDNISILFLMVLVYSNAKSCKIIQQQIAI